MTENIGTFILDKAAENFKDNPALISGDNVLNYRKYFRLVCDVSKRIHASELQPGSRVAVLSPNSIEYIILLMALIRSGFIAVPLNIRFPGYQTASMLESIACRIVIVSPGFGGTSHLNHLKVFHFNDFVNISKYSSQTATFYFRSVSPQKETTIFFTSGSSGDPKAVLHTYGNHYYSAVGANLNIPFQPGERWLLLLPLFHVGGFAVLFRAAVGGGAVIIPEPGEPLYRAVAKHSCTHLSLVSTQLYRLLKDTEGIKNRVQFKAILLGGSAFHQSLIDRSLERDLPIHISYGSTEMASQITTTHANDPPGRLYTAGRVLKYREIKVRSDGKIMVRGETLFKGYVLGYDVVPSVDREGWFDTGDTGVLDSDGCLTVSGRNDAMFVSGGENIHPEEIEYQLLLYEGVIQAVVVPVPSEEFGERPVAFLKMEQGKTVDTKSVQDFLKKSLPKYKIPDAVFLLHGSVEELNIKYDREALKRHAVGIISKK